MDDKMPGFCIFVQEYGRSPYLRGKRIYSRLSQGVWLRTGNGHISMRPLKISLLNAFKY